PSPPRSPPFPYTTLFRSRGEPAGLSHRLGDRLPRRPRRRSRGLLPPRRPLSRPARSAKRQKRRPRRGGVFSLSRFRTNVRQAEVDRKSTRLNSSHVSISY